MQIKLLKIKDKLFLNSGLLMAVALLFSFALTSPAYAIGGGNGKDFTDVVGNILRSLSDVPGVLSAISYILGISLGIAGIIKIKEHVEDPRTQLKDGFIRLIVGGGLFALPYVIDVMAATISEGIGGMGADKKTASSIFSNLSAYGGSFSAVVDNILDSTSNVSGLFAAFAYLMGIILAISGLLKLKEYVDDPTRANIREVAIRFLVGGALLTLPSVMAVLVNTISNGDDPADIIGSINKVLRLSNCGVSGVANMVFGGGGTLGSMFCNVYLAFNNFHLLIGALAYVAGLTFLIMGLLKLKEHVDNGAQVSIFEPVKRLLAAAVLFALPYMIEVAQTTITGGANSSMISSGLGMIGTILNTVQNVLSSIQSAICSIDKTASGCGAGGLDQMLVKAVSNFAQPLQYVVFLFAYLAGLAFIVTAISRLVKSSQDGAKGPTGMGTMMMFLTGGILLSSQYMMDAVSSTFFASQLGAGIGSSGIDMTFLKTAGGLGQNELQRIDKVMQAVTMFLAVVGWISFIRGWFIIKDVADGSGQASVMAGTTHIVGGALAVNVGPLMNAVQNTLGI